MHMSAAAISMSPQWSYGLMLLQRLSLRGIPNWCFFEINFRVLHWKRNVRIKSFQKMCLLHSYDFFLLTFQCNFDHISRCYHVLILECSKPNLIIKWSDVHQLWRTTMILDQMNIKVSKSSEDTLRKKLYQHFSDFHPQCCVRLNVFEPHWILYAKISLKREEKKKKEKVPDSPN